MSCAMLYALLLLYLFSTTQASMVYSSSQACFGFEEPCTVIPEEIPHGNVTQIKDMVGGVALYFRCDPDYVLTGKPVLTCCSGIWEEAFPRCVARDCKTHFRDGNTADGSFVISPDGKTKVAVFCDMTNAGGGWTVIQRRHDATTDFYRKWADYQRGFGHHDGNFWIGLDTIHELTLPDSELYVYMEASSTENAFARYSTFKVEGAADLYRLNIAGYSGTAGDCTYAGTRHNGKPFSAVDADNSVGGNCVTLYKGGWWYDNCHRCNPNGLYLNGSHPGRYAVGIDWDPYKGYYYSMTYIEMKVRRK